MGKVKNACYEIKENPPYPLTAIEARIVRFIKKGINSRLGMYIHVSYEYRKYVTYPLAVDKIYNGIIKAIRRLLRSGVVSEVKCDPVEYDVAKAYNILAKTSGKITYKNATCEIRKPKIKDLQLALLFALVEKYVVPLEPKFYRWSVITIERALNILEKYGSKYALKREAFNEIIKEIDRRIVRRTDRILAKAIALGYVLGQIREKPPFTPTLTYREIIALAKFRKYLSKLKLKTKAINECIEAIDLFFNLLDDYLLHVELEETKG